MDRLNPTPLLDGVALVRALETPAPTGGVRHYRYRGVVLSVALSNERGLGDDEIKLLPLEHDADRALPLGALFAFAEDLSSLIEIAQRLDYLINEIERSEEGRR